MPIKLPFRLNSKFKILFRRLFQISYWNEIVRYQYVLIRDGTMHKYSFNGENINLKKKKNDKNSRMKKYILRFETKYYEK